MLVCSIALCINAGTTARAALSHVSRMLPTRSSCLPSPQLRALSPTSTERVRCGYERQLRHPYAGAVGLALALNFVRCDAGCMRSRGMQQSPQPWLPLGSGA